MRALIALALVVLFVGGASAQHCAAPVVQQVYAAPQAVVVAPVVQLQAVVVPSVPLVQVYQPAAIVQQVQVQKVVQVQQVQKVVQQKQVVRQFSRTVIR